MSFEVRSYIKGDETSILNLFRQVFEVERSSTNWHKKFLQNYKDSVLIELALSEKTLAGQYTLLPVDIRFPQTVVAGAQSLDTMTHPDFRGKGIFTLLAQSLFERCKNENFELLYGFPNENSYPGFVKKLGWKHIGDIQSFVRPLKSEYFFKKKFPRLLKICRLLYLFPIIDFITHLIFPTRLSLNDSSAIKPLANFDVAYETFYTKFVRQQKKIHVDRTAAYMTWRYQSFDAEKNKLFGYYAHDGSLQGVVVVSSDSDRSAICELMAISPQIETALLKYAVRSARNAGLSTMTIWSTPSMSVHSLVSKLGFFRWTTFKFIIKDLLERHPEAQNLDQWFITAGDSDVF